MRNVYACVNCSYFHVVHSHHSKHEMVPAWHICKYKLKMNSYRYHLLHVMTKNDNEQHCQFLGHTMQQMDDD